MTVAARNTGTGNATGILAPIARLMTHLGYSLHIAQEATAENWTEKRKDILADTEEALAHLHGTQAVVTPFVDAATVALLNTLREDLETFRSTNTRTAKETVTTDLLTLVHNAAFTAASIDMALFGIPANAGANT